MKKLVNVEIPCDMCTTALNKYVLDFLVKKEQNKNGESDNCYISLLKKFGPSCIVSVHPLKVDETKGLLKEMKWDRAYVCECLALPIDAWMVFTSNEIIYSGGA